MTKPDIITLNLRQSFFVPRSPAFLGFCRLVLFGWLFLWYATTDFTFIATYPSAMWRPLPILEAFGLSAQPGVLVIWFLKAVWLTSMLLACIGLFTRTSIAIAFLVGLYMLGALHSFYKINHSDAGLLLSMLVLIFSRCGDAFSIDVLRRAAQTKGQFRVAPSGEYSWPIHMIRIVWALIFFLAGVAKLRWGGLDWMFSDSMLHLFLRKQVAWEPPTDLGQFLIQYPWLCVAMSTSAVIFELIAPLALFSRIARLLIVPSIFGMQIGIRLSMGDDFSQFMAIYLFLVPWLLVGAFTTRLAPSNKIEVLYDGNCGICGKTVAVLRRLDLFDRLRFRDIVAQWDQINADHALISREAAILDMHVVDDDGRIAAGFEGYRRMARALPLGWIFLPFFYLPIVSSIGRRIYRRVADGRHNGGQCAI